jgi:hypothetical protein
MSRGGRRGKSSEDINKAYMEIREHFSPTTTKDQSQSERLLSIFARPIRMEMGLLNAYMKVFFIYGTTVIAALRPAGAKTTN